MSQLSGALTVELAAGRLVEEIAQRTAVLVVSMLSAGPAGATCQREPDPGQGSADPDRGRHAPGDIGIGEDL